LSKVAQQCVTAHKESGIQQGGSFASIQLDVSDKQQIASLWSKVPQGLRNIDILGMSPKVIIPLEYNFSIFCVVNNAGFVKGMDHVGSIDESDVEAMFATNVFGLISITQLLVKGGSYPLRLHD